MYPLQILVFEHTFCSQYQWFDRQTKQIYNDKRRYQQAKDLNDPKKQ